MYIDRSVLEASLKKHLNGTRHVVVHGESGNGKTWLYKKVLSDLKMPYLVVNLANASRLGSLQEAFKDKVKKVLKQDYTDQKVYDVVEREPLEALMALLRREAGRKRAVIVLDNFEQILASEKLIKELSDSIVLLDDEDYASFDIRFCIVGVSTFTNLGWKFQKSLNRLLLEMLLVKFWNKRRLNGVHHLYQQ